MSMSICICNPLMLIDTEFFEFELIIDGVLVA